MSLHVTVIWFCSKDMRVGSRRREKLVGRRLAGRAAAPGLGSTARVTSK